MSRALGCLIGAALLSGCAANDPAPPAQQATVVIERVAPRAVETAERAALLEKLSGLEDELARWKGVAGGLREELAVGKRQAEETSTELAALRGANARLTEEREAARVRAGAAEQARDASEQALLALRREALRRERESLQAELAMLEAVDEAGQ